MKPIKFALVGLFALGALAFATPAYANASGSTTQSFQTIVMASANPCTGVPGTVTLIAHNVTHLSGNTFTTTTNGSFSFVPSDYPTDPSYTGHFMTWDGGTGQPGTSTATFTSTFVVNGLGSDGSRLVFHEVAHGTLLANGTITVLFDTPTCS